jgi:hypothetical protein
MASLHVPSQKVVKKVSNNSSLHSFCRPQKHVEHIFMLRYLNESRSPSEIQLQLKFQVPFVWKAALCRCAFIVELCSFSVRFVGASAMTFQRVNRIDVVSERMQNYSAGKLLSFQWDCMWVVRRFRENRQNEECFKLLIGRRSFKVYYEKLLIELSIWGSLNVKLFQA